MTSRVLLKHDNVAISLLDAYPAGTVGVFAALHLAIPAPTDWSDFWCIQPTWLFDCETDPWSIHASIFDFTVGTPPPQSISTSYSVLVYPSVPSGVWKFQSNFFQDASRSGCYAVDQHKRNVVAECCISFVLQHSFPPPPWLTLPSLWWKMRPRLSRKRRHSHGHKFTLVDVRCRQWMSLNHQKWQAMHEPEHLRPSRTFATLLSLRVTLYYLPFLLDNSVISRRLLVLAHDWWDQHCVQILFPWECKRVGEAISRYRAGLKNRYIMLNSIRVKRTSHLSVV